jgi:HK97 family phage portal protein
MATSAVFACVRVLAETIAMLPLHVYERSADGGKTRALSHPLYNVLHAAANPEMTSYELRETLTGHMALYGNAFAEIQYTKGGDVAALWPLNPRHVRIVRTNAGDLAYVYHTPHRPAVTLLADQVLHLRGLSGDGVIGYSVIGLARQAIGLALATEEFGARFFGNGARPGIVLQHPGTLSDDAYDRLRDSWMQRHAGLEQSHRVAILEEGLNVHEVGIPPEDAQFLQTRRYQVEEIARMYRVPLHMLAQLDRATNNNIEQQSAEFLLYTIQPWLVRFEQAISQRVIPAAQRRKYFAEFMVDGLLRADIDTRYAAYATGRQWGWLSVNEIRARENMNPIIGGDVYLTPLNMIDSGADARQADDTDVQVRQITTADVRQAHEQRALRSAGQRHQLQQAHRAVMLDAFVRILKREQQDVTRQAAKLMARSGAAFADWLTQYYRDDHPAYIARVMRPVLDTYARQVANVTAQEIQQPDTFDLDRFLAAYTATLAARHSAKSEARIRAALEDGAEQVTSVVADWPDQRANADAITESTRANNAIAKSVYIFAGVLALRWLAVGEDSCPYCQSLDGTTTGIDAAFLAAGAILNPDGADRPLPIVRNVGHPPVHDGCDCLIVSALL